MSVQTGTAVPHISGKQIAEYEVGLPPLREQQRIVSVLRALDEKVASNRRLAATLEQIVATEFGARFGRARPAATADGLPDGWRLGCLADLCGLVKQSVQPADAPDMPFEHFSIPAFDSQATPEVVLGAEMLSGKTLLPDGDAILLSKLNPSFKRIWWPRPRGQATAVCSPEFLVLEPHERVPTTYVYAVVSHDERFYNELLSHTTGTTGSRQRVKPTDALTCPVIVPSGEALAEWDALARPLYDLAHGQLAEARTLAGLRDELLPRLVSGRQRIADEAETDAAERATEELAAA